MDARLVMCAGAAAAGTDDDGAAAAVEATAAESESAATLRTDRVFRRLRRKRTMHTR